MGSLKALKEKSFGKTNGKISCPEMNMFLKLNDMSGLLKKGQGAYSIYYLS